MFVKLEAGHIDTIYGYLRNDNTDDTTYAALSLLGWMKPHDPYIEIDDKYVAARFTFKGETAYLTPLVKDKKDFPYAAMRMHDHKAVQIHGVLDWQVEEFEKLGYEVQYSRKNSEYLYTPESLITLRGKKLHSKRNFINGFKEEYVWREYDGSEKDYKQVMSLFCKWCHWRTGLDIKPCEYENWKKSPEIVEAGYDLEANVIEMMLKDKAGDLNCTTYMLFVNDELAGFVSGEILPNGVGTVYLEKGDISYRGIYPLIDNLFCKSMFEGKDVRYVNKQEDMGIEGLRKSKESYRPIKLADRYIATKWFDGKKVKVSSKALSIGS